MAHSFSMMNLGGWQKCTRGTRILPRATSHGTPATGEVLVPKFTKRSSNPVRQAVSSEPSTMPSESGSVQTARQEVPPKRTVKSSMAASSAAGSRTARVHDTQRQTGPKLIPRIPSRTASPQSTEGTSRDGQREFLDRSAPGLSQRTSVDRTSRRDERGGQRESLERGAPSPSQRSSVDWMSRGDDYGSSRTPAGDGQRSNWRAPPRASSAPKGPQGTSTSQEVQGPPVPPVPERGLAVTWLGTSSGSPSVTRNVSGTLVRVPGGSVLIDCGEGTIHQLFEGGLDSSLISTICVTHLHGDHCFGLSSLLHHLDLVKRTLPEPERRATNVFGPPGLAQLVRMGLVMTGACEELVLPLTVTELVLDEEEAHPLEPLEGSGDRIQVARLAPSRLQEESEFNDALEQLRPRLKEPPPRNLPLAKRGQDFSSKYGGDAYFAAKGIFWDLGQGARGALRVRAAQLQHRVPCWGYVLQEVDGKEDETQADDSEKALSGRKVVILGDTMDSTPISPMALGCDLLAHEATFMRGMEERCAVAQHSTAWMAGRFGDLVRAQHLVLTHFSSRYAEDSFAFEGNKATKRWNQEEEERRTELGQLYREARSTYGSSGTLSTASDFLTIHVPKRTAAARAAAKAVAAPREAVPA